MAVWNERLLEVFYDLCIKEVDKNNRPHTHFNAEGWTNIINGFEQETGKSYTKKQLKNKWDVLKSELRSWKELKGKETGLGWDHRLQTIDAPDEWWRAKIEKVKEYAKFRKKGIAPDFEAKLDMMFGGTTATGEHAYAPSSSLPIPRSPEQVNNLESSGDSKEDDQPKNLPKRRSERTKKDKGVVPKKEKIGGAAFMASQISRMCSAIESRSTATSMANRSVQESARNSITEVMNDIVTLPGAEAGSELWLFATRFMKNPDNREMHCTMKDPTHKLLYLKTEMQLDAKLG
ncbi:hypothetical protein ACLB2K_034756 [Fragaria x ananassa]